MTSTFGSTSVVCTGRCATVHLASLYQRSHRRVGLFGRFRGHLRSTRDSCSSNRGSAAPKYIHSPGWSFRVRWPVDRGFDSRKCLCSAACPGRYSGFVPVNSRTSGRPAGRPGVRVQKRAKKRLDDAMQLWTVVCDRETRSGELVQAIHLDLSIGRAVNGHEINTQGDPPQRKHMFPCVGLEHPTHL